MKIEIIEGKGPEQPKGSLLFVHGAQHAAWCWENFMGYFGDAGYKCYAMSFRGHGNSEGREDINNFGVDDYVEDIKQVVEGLPEKPVLVGHSLGGFVIERYLGLYDSSVAGAVLLCSMLPDGTGMPYQLKLLAKHVTATKVMLDINGGKKVSAATLAKAIVFSGNLSEEEVAPYVDLIQAESSRITGDQSKPATSNWDVAVPVRVVGCTGDWMFPDQSANAAKYGTSAIMAEGLCHDAMLDPDWKKAAEAVEGAVKEIISA